MTPCCEGATSCLYCGRSFCMAETPSPGEPNQCADCHDLETGLRYGLTQPNTDPHTWSAAS